MDPTFKSCILDEKYLESQCLTICFASGIVDEFAKYIDNNVSKSKFSNPFNFIVATNSS